MSSLAITASAAPIETEPFHVVVTKSGPVGQAPRQIGRVKILPNDDSDQVSGIIFNKPVSETTAEDIRWMIDDAEVQYCYFGKHLLIDFSIIVPNYRQDPQFQRY